MKKENAKAWTCILLGAESIGMITASVAAIFTLAELLNLPVEADNNQWFFDVIYYLLALLVVIYGFIVRPLRRKAVTAFSSVIHFGDWVYIAELFSVIVFILCGYFDCPLISLVALSIYSAWKIIEISADMLLLNRHSFRTE